MNGSPTAASLGPRPAWAALGLAALVAAVYAPTLGHGFVWDDFRYVVENPHVNGGLTWGGVRQAFTAPYAGNWAPLMWLSHMLDVELFGLNASAHHAVNVGLHAANAVLLFDVLRRVTGAAWRSACVAALFAVHPLRVESVAWVAERKDVLSVLFGLLTLEAYAAWVRTPSALRRALLVAAFAAAVATKPTLVPLPFALLLLDWWPLRRIADARTLGRVVVEKLPLFVVAAAAAAAAVVAQRAAGALWTADSRPLWARIGDAATSYVAYIAKTLWPADLSPLYPLDPSTRTWSAFGAAAAVVALCVLAARQARARPWLFVGWFWFVGTLGPAIGLVAVGSHSMADRFTYWPHVGLLLAAVWGVAELVGDDRARLVAASTAAALCIVACGIVARRHVGVWRDEETLWTRALEVAPENPMAENNLGVALLERGRTDEAVAHLRKATLLAPRYVDAYANLGRALRVLGRLDEAGTELARALRVDPASAAAQYETGMVLAARGRLGDAEERLREAVRLRPADASMRCDLGVVLAATGRIDEALVEFREALRLAPRHAAARRNLAIALADRGRLDEAVSEALQGTRDAPLDANLRRTLGLLLRRKGDAAGAVRELEEALRLDPTLETARRELESLRARR